MKPRLVIADDHIMFRDALKDLFLYSNLDIIGEAGDGLETIEIVENLKPDILLLDINMPKLDGLDVMERLRKRLPELKIIILTMYEHLQDLALKSGANGYFHKDSDANDLLAGIERVFKGETFISNRQPFS